MSDDCPFALTIEEVEVTNVSSNHVTFKTRSDGPQEVDCLLREFTCARDKIRLNLPPSAPPHIEVLQIGALGRLCLHEDVWQSTSQGFPIHAAGTGAVVFKYPICLAIPSPHISTLQVVPTSVLVKGFVTGIAEAQDIELLGSDCADSQNIEWNGARNIRIGLSTEGAQRFNLPPSATSIEMWPIRLVVAGSPATEPDRHGTANILNAELAAGTQTLQFERSAPQVAPRLTQTGCSRFHVVPGAVRAIAEGQIPSDPAGVAEVKAIIAEWDRIDRDEPGALSESSRRTLETAREILKQRGL